MQLRRNHTVKDSGKGLFVFRALIFVFILGGGLIYIAKNMSFYNWGSVQTLTNDSLGIAGDIRTFIPKGGGMLLHKKEFSLAWDPNKKSALWVAYRLSKTSLRQKKIEDRIPFSEDENVKGTSSSYEDYTRSGYDRGHLVAAADMSWDSTAFNETFLMSNISPQKRGFNGGIWKELEILSRNWTYDHESVIIISGPVFTPGKKFSIGRNKIEVPDYFFKIICTGLNDHPTCTSFLIPNEISYKPLRNYITTIDDIEHLSGLDFFHFMWEDDLENKVESKTDTLTFPFDEKKYKLRIEKWNYQ